MMLETVRCNHDVGDIQTDSGNHALDSRTDSGNHDVWDSQKDGDIHDVGTVRRQR